MKDFLYLIGVLASILFVGIICRNPAAIFYIPEVLTAIGIMLGIAVLGGGMIVVFGYAVLGAQYLIYAPPTEESEE